MKPETKRKLKAGIEKRKEANTPNRIRKLKRANV